MDIEYATYIRNNVVRTQLVEMSPLVFFDTVVVLFSTALDDVVVFDDDAFFSVSLDFDLTLFLWTTLVFFPVDDDDSSLDLDFVGFDNVFDFDDDFVDDDDDNDDDDDSFLDLDFVDDDFFDLDDDDDFDERCVFVSLFVSISSSFSRVDILLKFLFYKTLTNIYV